VATGGRLILGFYSKFEEMIQAQKKISQVKEDGYLISGQVTNESRSEIAIFIDRSD